MCIFIKDAECERLNGANAENNDALPLAAPVDPILARVEGLLVRDLFRGILFDLGLADIHRDVRVGNIVRRDDGFVVKRVAVGSMAERKPNEKKREQRPTAMPTGKKELNQLKAADQRRMKLQYRSDRKSNASRRLPTRFTRR